MKFGETPLNGSGGEARIAAPTVDEQRGEQLGDGDQADRSSGPGAADRRA